MVSLTCSLSRVSSLPISGSWTIGAAPLLSSPSTRSYVGLSLLSATSPLKASPSTATLLSFRPPSSLSRKDAKNSGIDKFILLAVSVSSGTTPACTAFS